MNKILLLTDFSELSSYARQLADQVAFHTRSELHVLKVVDVPSEVVLTRSGDLEEGMADDVLLLTKELDSSKHTMEEWCGDLKCKARSNVVFGRFLNTVQAYVQENSIDLIIMGTHGVSGLKEFISGSITEQVVLQSEVPVLSLKCNREGLNFSNFLITGDFDTGQEVDLTTLKALQKVFQSTMHLLWVNTSSHYTTTSDAMERMRSFAEHNGMENTKFHVYNDTSKESGILNFSNNFDASHAMEIDIIAIEKKNKSKLGYALSGCEATSLVNHIFRPLITYSKK